MNILVLGGNGYLGSKVVRQFVVAGHKVVCTRRKGSDLTRMYDICDRICWIPASIDGVVSAMQYVTFDHVLNMVCSYGKDGSDNVIDANLEFPLKILHTAVENGTKNFITIGTGLPDELNLYSFSKKAFGEFGRFYAEKQGINFYNLLVEMFYGPDEPKNRFLSSIIHKMLDGESVDTTVGTQHRDLICVDDVVKAVMMVMNSPQKGFFEIPVGTGIAPAVSEIVDYLWNETGRKSIVRKGMIPMRDGEPDCIADTSALCGLGKWNPRPWRKGLHDMVEKIKLGGV